MCYQTPWYALFTSILQLSEYIKNSKILMGQTENSAVMKDIDSMRCHN